VLICVLFLFFKIQYVAQQCALAATASAAAAATGPAATS